MKRKSFTYDEVYRIALFVAANERLGFKNSPKSIKDILNNFDSKYAEKKKVK